MFIAWDGTVYPCCMHIDKPLANILKKALGRYGMERSMLNLECPS
jgi:hypothetical protein